MLKFGVQIQEKLTQGQQINYDLLIDSPYKTGDDLILKVLPLDFISDPNIYISKVSYDFQTLQIKELPDEMNSEWQCSSYGVDTCAIHSQNISMKEHLYITIQCPYQNCEFEIFTMSSSEFMLEDGIEFQSFFVMQEAKVFNYKIPERIQQNSSIVIKASAYRGNAHDFKLSIKPSKATVDSEQSQNDIKFGISAWKKGQVVRINQNNFKNGWCLGCEIEITVDVQDEGYYHVMVQSEDSVPLLQNDFQLDDITGERELTCYRYYVKSEMTDLQVRLTTYSGNVHLLINPRDIPQKNEDFMFTTEQDANTIIDVTTEMRNSKAQQPKGLYYICTYGEILSTYTVKVKEFMHHQNYAILEDGYSETFELEGDQMHVHLYKVPKLKDQEEDIRIEFDLTVSKGVDPVFAAAFCVSQDIEQCKDEVQKELVMRKNSKYTKGISTGQMLKIEIDHDKQKCQDSEDGEDCYYVIAVINPSLISKIDYKIMVSHSQKNHKLLQESIPHLDSVEMSQYQYYKFTVVDDENIQSLTFDLSQLHGDSDIFISRQHIQPNKYEYEWKSVKLGQHSDYIEITASDPEANNTLVGAYFISIYGYSYATFSLLVSVQRIYQNLFQSLRREAIMMYESIPYQKTLHDSSDMFFGYFDVDINEDEALSILIDVQNIQGKTNTYIKYQGIPTFFSYDYIISEGVLEIKPSDENYHKNRTYYFLTEPDITMSNINSNTNYIFSVSWRYHNNLPHLNQQSKMNLQLKYDQYSYMIHYVMDQTQAIKLQVFSKKGHNVDLFVSVQPEKKFPTKDNYDFTTGPGSNYRTGKSIILPASLIIKKNPSCQDLGYSEEEPCTVYIGVLCLEKHRCELQVELDYQQNTPRKIFFGENKFSSLSSDSQAYYYLVVPYDKRDDIFAQLTTYQGKADIYMKLQLSNLEDYGDLATELPSPQNDQKVSVTKLGQEFVHVQKDKLDECFPETIDENSHTINDCLVIFGIFPSQQLNDQRQDFQPEFQQNIMYNFVAYQGLTEIYNQHPMTSFLEGSNFKYFLFQQTCDSCQMQITLSGNQQGELQFYLKKGLKLPSLIDYDITQSTHQSEILMIDLNNKYFKDNNITSLADYYVIGVFSEKDQSFQITISSSYIAQIYEGIQLKNKIQANQTHLYQYYHWNKKDIQISVEVTHGTVDLLVEPQNYYESIDDQQPNINENRVAWKSLNISSMNFNDGKQVLIMQNDNNYCQYCYYQMGVRSKDQDSSYQIQVQQLNAELTSESNFIRLQSTKLIKLEETNSIKIYQFILESIDEVTITPTLIVGNANIYLSYDQTIESSFYKQSDSKIISINSSDIEINRNYYLIIESVTSLTELTIIIDQSLNFISLFEGIPQVLYYKGNNDKNKYMIYYLPKGNSQVKINLKSKTQDFFPALFYHLFSMEDINSLIFPPSEEIDYNETKFGDWDQDTFSLILTLDFQNLDIDQGLVLNLQYAKDLQQFYKNDSQAQFQEEAQAVITVSHNQITKIMPFEEFFGSLGQSNYKKMLFKIDPPADKYVEIFFSKCIGDSEIKLVKDPFSLEQLQDIKSQKRYGMEQLFIEKNIGQFYILAQSIDYYLDIQKNQYFEFKTEFSIKVMYLDELELSNQEQYIAPNGGHITYSYLKEGKGQVQLQWLPLVKYQNGDLIEEVKNVRYKLIFSQNSHADLDQVCAIKKQQSSDFTIYEQIDGENTFVTNLPSHQETQFNVIAVILNKQIAVPYRPISLQVPGRRAYGSAILYIFMALFIVLLSLGGFYFYLRNRQLEKLVEEEIRTINSIDNTENEQSHTTYHKLGGRVSNQFAAVDVTDHTIATITDQL